MQVEETLAQGGSRPAQVGALPVPAEAEEASSWRKGSTLCVPLNNDTLLLWYLRLFPQTFLVVKLLTPVPSGCLFTANSCPLPGFALQTPLSSSQLPFTTDDS